jgi:hypothetical protein
VVRGGTAIAFAVKLLFSASMGVGYAQHVWYCLRSKSYSLCAVDSLFTLRDNPLGFFSGEVLSTAKLSSLIAALSWALALVPILVPASISVRSAEHSQRLVDMPVFTLNFTKDVMEARYHNDTQIFPVQLARHNGVGALWDMYSENTATATGFVYNTLYGKRIIDALSPCGANCSFEQTFQGPAYKCDDIDFSATDDVNNPFCSFTSAGEFGDCGAVFQDSRSDGSLDGITWYWARDSLEAESDCSPEEDIYCPPPRADWQDGKLWVAYQYLFSEYRGLFDDFGRLLDPEAQLPTEAFDRRMFVCQSYNATYTISRWYENFQQTVTGNITQVHPLHLTGTPGTT